MRRAARRDKNETGLVADARRMGFKIFYTSELGDLIAQLCGITELWEVKGPNGKLTDAQCRRKQQGLQARIVRGRDDLFLARAQMMQAATAIQRARMG